MRVIMLIRIYVVRKRRLADVIMLLKEDQLVGFLWRVIGLTVCSISGKLARIAAIYAGFQSEKLFSLISVLLRMPCFIMWWYASIVPCKGTFRGVPVDVVMSIRLPCIPFTVNLFFWKRVFKFFPVNSLMYVCISAWFFICYLFKVF